MSDPVEPALTKEEWANYQQEKWLDLEYGTVQMGWKGNNNDPNELRIFPVGECAEYTGKGRHALAALALSDQPFGFTREDVEVLADAIYTIHGPKMDALHPGVEQALDSIRERIGALLPPEGPFNSADLFSPLLPPE